MRIFKFIFIFLFLVSVVFISIYYFFFLTPTVPLEELYEVEIPSKKNIKQMISVTGKLKLKDQVKIGSVVSGRVKAIYVEENHLVKEGDLLVEIDTGLGDTEVREAQGAFERALAELEFHEANFQRKKQLFEEHFLADVELQEAKRNYLTTSADVKALKANYEKKLMAFENSRVYAPTAGIIIHVNVAKGEKVSSDLEGGTLLSLAPDIQKIEVELEINEKDVGQVQKGQSVQMVVDTYPNRIFKSFIHNMSFIAKADKEKECVYQAKAYIENPQLLLRPGMNINATIDVASVESVLTVTSRAFLIKKENLKTASNLLNISIQSIDEKEKQELLQSDSDDHIQFIWVICDDCFKEIPVKIGITDHISFEIKSGLKGDENLIVDIMEDDEMQKIYDTFYRKL